MTNFMLLLVNFSLAGLLLVIVTVVGIPIIFGFVNRGRILTKFVLSFVIGYCVISLIAITINSIGFDPLFFEFAVIFIAIITNFHPGIRNKFIKSFSPDSIIPSKNQSEHEYNDSLKQSKWQKHIRFFLPLINIWSPYHPGYDRDDLIAFGLSILYLLILVGFFTEIYMWMAGDAVAHASVIRLIMDRGQVPVSIVPFGTNWEYYPKAFHFFTYPFASITSVLSAIEVVPIVFSALIPLVFYSFLREMEKEKIALIAFIIACFCMPQHWMSLIWAGYPSLTAELLLVSLFLIWVTERRLILLILPALIFTHTRFIGYLAVIIGGILFVYLVRKIFKEYCGDKTLFILGNFLLVILIAISPLLLGFSYRFFPQILTNEFELFKFIFQWIWVVPAVVGVIIVFNKKGNLPVIMVGWIIGILVFAFLIDIRLLPARFAEVGRALSKLYLPVSFFAAFTVSHLITKCSSPRMKRYILISVLLFGIIFMSGVFGWYALTWSIPDADYKAIQWIGDQNFDDEVIFNSDEIGAWIYPLTGITLTNPRFIPKETSAIDLSELVSDWDPDLSGKEMNPRDVSGLLYISSLYEHRDEFDPPFYDSHFGFYEIGINDKELDRSEKIVNLYSEGGVEIYRIGVLCK